MCFICNLEKYVFLKSSISFEQHIAKDHNMWNYVFFMYNLRQKLIVDMNGIESYIHSKLLTDDIAWIPLRRALVLEQEVKSGNAIRDKLLDVNRKLGTLLNN